MRADKQIKFWVTDRDKSRVIKLAEQNGCSLGTVLRAMVRLTDDTKIRDSINQNRGEADENIRQAR